MKNKQNGFKIYKGDNKSPYFVQKEDKNKI